MTITNDEIEGLLNQSSAYIINKIGQWLSKGSGGTVESVDKHYVNIVKYKSKKGSSYIQLPEELQNSSRGLVNMKNKDNECFRWCHIRHLNPPSKDPQRIKKLDRKMVNQLNYTDIEFPVNIKQYNKIKNKIVSISTYLIMKINSHSQFTSQKNGFNTLNLLLITENENNHYVLIKDFNRFMYNQTKHEHK